MRATRNFILSAIAGAVVGMAVDVATDTVWFGAFMGFCTLAIINAALWQAEVRSCRRTLERWDKRERIMRRMGE